MKRDEKNLMSRQKILDCAFREFGERGYGRSSINAICSGGELSKGILYHHFKDKDELYLACIKTLFDGLTTHLKQKIQESGATKETHLEQYFSARLAFFQENPLYHRLFCDVIVAPPAQLATAIAEIKQEFDEFNISVLTELLQAVTLRTDVSIQQAVETFRLYQDFVNARWQMEAFDTDDIAKREQLWKRSLQILLYGVVKREGN